MQDKIQEIMGLVDEAIDAQYSVAIYGSQDWLVEKRDISIKAIESKLRELVREPLSVDDIDKEYNKEWSCFDGEYEAFLGGIRYAERAHNITNTSN